VSSFFRRVFQFAQRRIEPWGAARSQEYEFSNAGISTHRDNARLHGFVSSPSDDDHRCDDSSWVDGGNYDARSDAGATPEEQDHRTHLGGGAADPEALVADFVARFYTTRNQVTRCDLDCHGFRFASSVTRCICRANELPSARWCKLRTKGLG
jgi:hypothetical protein